MLITKNVKKNQCSVFVCVLQESQWLDSVSLLIKDSLEGDMIDNLSGSVFHHYCSPPVCKDCKGHSQEVSGISSKRTHTNTHIQTHTYKHIPSVFFIQARKLLFVVQ